LCYYYYHLASFVHVFHHSLNLVQYQLLHIHGLYTNRSKASFVKVSAQFGMELLRGNVVGK